MIFYFLITIVFIAEIIITIAVLQNLIKFDKKIMELNGFVDNIKPSIKELMITTKKLSIQLLELSPLGVKFVKSFFADLILGQVKSLAGALTFWLVKREVEKHV